MNEKFFKVLWIDDDPSEELMDVAKDDYGIELISKECYQEGLEWLNANITTCDAVILDVYCKASEDESPNFESFQSSVIKVNRACRDNGVRFIPWFVYTGGPSGHTMGYEFIKSLAKAFDRSWDDKDYYNKPADADALFSKIQEEAMKSPVTQLKNRYPFAFGLDHAIDNTMVKIISCLESDDCSRQYEMIRSVGIVIESLRNYLVNAGFLPYELNKGISISPCASFLGMREMQEIIPQYIQQCIFMCALTGSEGGHALPAKVDVEAGKVPHLLPCLIMALLTFLNWLHSQMMDKGSIEARRKLTSKLYQKFKENGKKRRPQEQ